MDFNRIVEENQLVLQADFTYKILIWIDLPNKDQIPGNNFLKKKAGRLVVWSGKKLMPVI